MTYRMHHLGSRRNIPLNPAGPLERASSRRQEGLMTSKNVTRADLAQAGADAVSLPKYEAIALSEQVLTEICDTWREGEVKLSGFGNFAVRNKA